jgi:hypothetical protein
VIGDELDIRLQSGTVIPAALMQCALARLGDGKDYPPDEYSAITAARPTTPA